MFGRYKKKAEDYIPKEKEEKTKNPWYFEKIRNGLKATNVFESSSGLSENRRIPVQYFEYDRIYGRNAYSNKSFLKVIDMFDELCALTPKTRGFIFGEYHYLYHGMGIVRINHETENEDYFSNDTLRNENVACYFNLVENPDEEKVKSMISELERVEDASTGRSKEDRDWKRIPYQDSE